MGEGTKGEGRGMGGGKGEFERPSKRGWERKVSC